VPLSRYLSLVVVDIENWSGRTAVIQAELQRELREIAEASAGVTGTAWPEVRVTTRGDGLVLGYPADVPKEHLSDHLVVALTRALRAYGGRCRPGADMRLRVALHAGDVLADGEEWSGRAVTVACRLVDSDVLHRVLTAADRAVLAVIVSGEWYEAVVRQGYAADAGFEEVWFEGKGCSGPAWVRVPGYSEPPGLTPADLPRPDGPAPRDDAGGQIVVHGDYVLHHKISFHGPVGHVALGRGEAS
jgi:class 3 adenylate cyclase